MQYVGLGIPKSFNSIIQHFVNHCLQNEIAIDHDSNFDLDEENKSGLQNFCNFFDLNVYRLRGKSKRKNKFHTSSDTISNDISNIHFIPGHKSKFLTFLLSSQYLLPERFFLIFTDIWSIEELDYKIRYLKTDMAGIVEYFDSNIGWEMILYDYKTGNQAFHYNIPLIFEISNNVAFGDKGS
jgi:hypothetical protein